LQDVDSQKTLTAIRKAADRYQIPAELTGIGPEDLRFLG
jgi:hypothetical protein